MGASLLINLKKEVDCASTSGSCIQLVLFFSSYISLPVIAVAARLVVFNILWGMKNIFYFKILLCTVPLIDFVCFHVFLTLIYIFFFNLEFYEKAIIFFLPPLVVNYPFSVYLPIFSFPIELLNWCLAKVTKLWPSV